MRLHYVILLPTLLFLASCVNRDVACCGQQLDIEKQAVGSYNTYDSKDYDVLLNLDSNYKGIIDCTLYKNKDHDDYIFVDSLEWGIRGKVLSIKTDSTTLTARLNSNFMCLDIDTAQIHLFKRTGMRHPVYFEYIQTAYKLRQEIAKELFSSDKQHVYNGVLLDEDLHGLGGVIIEEENGKFISVSDECGRFYIPQESIAKRIFLISMNKRNITIRLENGVDRIEVVMIPTRYYEFASSTKRMFQKWQYIKKVSRLHRKAWRKGFFRSPTPNYTVE